MAWFHAAMKEAFHNVLGVLTSASTLAMAGCAGISSSLAPAAADAQGRFNPDFRVEGRLHRICGELEHTARANEGGALVGLRLKAHVERWDERSGRFTVVSPESGAFRSFTAMPLAANQVVLFSGNASDAAGTAGIENRLLDCSLQVTPPANTRAAELDVTATATIAVRPGAGAEGQRDIEIKIPLAWKATRADGGVVLTPNPGNPQGVFRW